MSQKFTSVNNGLNQLKKLHNIGVAGSDPTARWPGHASLTEGSPGSPLHPVMTHLILVSAGRPPCPESSTRSPGA